MEEAHFYKHIVPTGLKKVLGIHDLRLKSGAVGRKTLSDMGINATIFLKLTVMVRLQTAPTGSGGILKLPKYLVKRHQTSPAVVRCFVFSKVPFYFRILL